MLDVAPQLNYGTQLAPPPVAPQPQPAAALPQPATPQQQPAASEPQPASGESHMTFRQVLSALNPLQYLPGIGTIYRAITGDQIPEVVRDVGSIVVGALTGGPIGAAISAGIAVAEKVSGVDFDKIGQSMLASIGISHQPAASPDSAPVQVAGPGPSAPPAAVPALVASRAAAATPEGSLVSLAVTSTSPAASLTAAWSPAQLAAYGVTTASDGALKLAGLSGADVLNSLEMSRIQVARNAYGRTAALAA